ncbi:hypothetical protein SUGI_0670980 [Cryptomeria japonica]|nr:hypothetical protein SUGI_0670980 [Cryptomeria japonica]
MEINLPIKIKENITLWREKAVTQRFIGAMITRTQTRAWVKDNWSQEVVLKFIPKGFFIVTFRDEMVRNKILNQQNWVYDSAHLYLQLWQPNFDLVPLVVYKEPIWIWLYNLSMEYWGDSSLEHIGRSLGTLLEVDEEIIENDSYLFDRIKIVAVKKFPSILYLKTGGSRWRQHVEVELPSPGGECSGFKDHIAKASNGLVKPVKKWIQKVGVRNSVTKTVSLEQEIHHKLDSPRLTKSFGIEGECSREGRLVEKGVENTI